MVTNETRAGKSPVLTLQIINRRNNMSTFMVNKVDKLPEISRAGRKSEELNMIIDALKQSVKGNAVFNIVGIKPGNAYNSMQQRIRAQAKKLGYKIVIRFDSVNETLFFQATSMSTEKITGVTADKNSVTSNEITGIKSKAKTSK
jgi:hypothetical protein